VSWAPRGGRWKTPAGAIVGLVAGGLTLALSLWMENVHSVLLHLILPCLVSWGVCAALPRVSTVLCFAAAFVSVPLLAGDGNRVFTYAVVLVLCGGAGLSMGLRRERARALKGEPKCPACGYVLYYARGERCPECGRYFRLQEVGLEKAEVRDGVLYPKG
jgi:predicted RNA-binding Zn-ribbon protein involved in translation (DUF1610 family)